MPGGGRKEALLQGLSPLVLVSSSSLSPSLSLPRACIFGSMAGFLPKVMRTLESAIPTLEGCASASEQPWRLPVLSSMETEASLSRTLSLESQQRFSFLSLPLSLLLGYRTQ